MTLSNLNSQFVAGTYRDDLYTLVKQYENPGMGEPGIHDVEGNPTIGYGFDLTKWSAAQITDALTYAYSNNLSMNQQAGLDLLEAWRTGTPVWIRDDQYRPRRILLILTIAFRDTRLCPHGKTVEDSFVSRRTTSSLLHVACCRRHSSRGYLPMLALPIAVKRRNVARVSSRLPERSRSTAKATAASNSRCCGYL